MRFFQTNFDDIRLRNMYKNYVSDLSKYDDSGEISVLFFDRIYAKISMDYGIVFPYLIVENDRICGFIITQFVDETVGVSPPLWYVVEFYIVPEERQKGLGMAAVQQFQRGISGEFFLYILKKNIPAMTFWNCCRDHLGWKECKRDDLILYPDCDLRVFFC